MTSLIGKNAEVAGRSGRNPESEVLVAHRPARRKRPTILPCALHPVVGLGKFGVGRVPRFFGKRQRPHRLRFGANQRDGTEAFKFAARAGVEKFVIGPDRTNRFKIWKRSMFHGDFIRERDYAAS